VYFWPQWILPSVITAALVGLPIALLGAWMVGVRAERGAFRPSRADFQLLGILSLFLIVAAALFIWVFWPKASPAPAGQNAAAAPSPNSLAVLPFANLSGNPGKRYLSEGISDELINRLSQLPSLRVDARASSFAFEDKSMRNLEGQTPNLKYFSVEPDSLRPNFTSIKQHVTFDGLVCLGS
jgi:hypothetical protein